MQVRLQAQARRDERQLAAIERQWVRGIGRFGREMGPKRREERAALRAARALLRQRLDPRLARGLVTAIVPIRDQPR